MRWNKPPERAAVTRSAWAGFVPEAIAHMPAPASVAAPVAPWAATWAHPLAAPARDEDVADYDDMLIGAPEQAVPAQTVEMPALPTDQLEAAVAAMSREIVERIAWEVVPRLTETIVREYLERLLRAREGERR